MRLHATKDYLDLPLLLEQYGLKHTFNLVPSLLVQLDEYALGRTDEVQRLCMVNAGSLLRWQRSIMGEWILTLRRDTMVSPLPRLCEIYDAIAVGQAESLDTETWRDAQVLFNLAWLGTISRANSALASSLLLQQRGFSELQKRELFVEMQGVLDSVIPTMVRLQAEGKIEVCVTPYYHPILPLLIDTDVALESMPRAVLPYPPIKARVNAEKHVVRALSDWEHRSGVRPQGMWLAEGGLSLTALEVLAQNGVEWTATDEDVLKNSLGELWDPIERFFPHVVSTPAGSVTVLFRDHALSDAIGFEYASRNAEEAVDDFVRRLEERRRLLVSNLGEQALDEAVIPIMLDGENCWEFYPNNGADFLNALMARLSDTSKYTSVTCSEAVLSKGVRSLPKLVAGSWINGTFDVWIGSVAKNLAWTLLGRAREAVMRCVGADSPLWEMISVLEASDWFWWYDEQHQAPHKHMFDEVFRMHLRTIFAKCGVQVPEECMHPLTENSMSNDNGSNQTRVPVVFGTSAMHRSQALVRDVGLEAHNDWQRITVRLDRRPIEKEEVVIRLFGQDGIERGCLIAHEETLWRSPHHDEGFDWYAENVAALYVHAHQKWTLRISEEDNEGGVRTADVVIEI